MLVVVRELLGLAIGLSAVGFMWAVLYFRVFPWFIKLAGKTVKRGRQYDREIDKINKGGKA